MSLTEYVADFSGYVSSTICEVCVTAILVVTDPLKRHGKVWHFAEDISKHSMYMNVYKYTCEACPLNSCQTSWTTIAPIIGTRYLLFLTETLHRTKDPN